MYRKPKGYRFISLGMPSSSLAQRLYRLLFFIHQDRIRAAAHKLRGFDLIISHFYPMNLIAQKAKKLYGVKYRYHNHGVADPVAFDTLHERAYLWLFNIFSNMSLKGCDEAVSISRYLADVLEKETGIRGEVEYDPIDTRRFNRRVNRSRVRKKHGLGKSPTFLYVGRISPHKGVHLLLKAFMIAKDRLPDAKLLIVGKPTFRSYMQKLKGLADDSVIFAGFVPDEDLPDYYGACDVYATATLWEGFDMPMAEANACGRPVIAFDIGPHKEVLKEGKLLKPGDLTGFAQAMVKYV
jgi:1,2-diacylglycerol 3-alpha-glucosyltransferase